MLFPQYWIRYCGSATLIIMLMMAGVSRLGLAQTDELPPLAVISPENARDLVLLREWNMPSFRDFHETCNVAFSPDGTLLAAACRSQFVQLWAVATGELVHSFKGNSLWTGVAFSPDGTRVVSGGGDNKARVWDAATGEEYLVLSGPRYFVEDVQYTPDGAVIAGANDDHTLRFWDAATGALLITKLAAHRGPVNGLAISPDGQIVITCSNDESFKVWTVPDGGYIALRQAHTDYAIRPAFNPAGTLIATVGWDGRVTLWGVPAADDNEADGAF